MKPPTFLSWYKSLYHEWWKNEKASLQGAWNQLLARGVPATEVEEVFNAIASAIKAQYGE